MLTIVSYLVMLVLGVASFWYPTGSAWTFIVIFIFLLEGFALVGVLAHRGFKANVDQPPLFLSQEEAALVSAFPEYFKYPGVSVGMSSALAGNAMMAIIFVPILAFKGLYVEAAIIGINWFPALRLSYRLSPLNGLKINSANLL